MQQQVSLNYLPGSNDPEDIDAARAFQQAGQWQWDKDLKMALKRIQSSLDSKIYGYSVIHNWWEEKETWDSKALGWKGRTKSEVIKPDYFGADPDAESSEDWSFCYTSREVTVGWAVQRWPELAEQIRKASQEQLEQEPGASTDHADWTMNQNNVDSEDGSSEGQIVGLIRKAQGSRYTGENAGEKGPGDNMDDQSVTLQQIFFKDYETRQQTVMELIPAPELAAQGLLEDDGQGHIFNPQTEELWGEENWPTREKRKYDEPLYPTGRYVLRIGKVILNPKKEDQRWSYRSWGFVVKPNYILPHMWQGMGSVPMSKQLQDWMNVAGSHMTNYLKFFGDPRIVVEKGALVKDPHLNKPRLLSKAGAIWVVAKNAINRIRVDPPVGAPSGTMDFISFFAQELRNSSGMQEQTQGIAGKNMTAAESTRLNANSRLRVALMGVIEEEALKSTADQLAELNQENWEVDEWVRILGQNNRKGIMQITQGMKSSKYDVDIKIGTSMPFDKERRRQEYVEVAALVANPANFPMLEELLVEFDIPNMDEILQKVEGYKMFEWVMQIQQAYPDLMQKLQSEVQIRQQMQQQAQGPQPQAQGAA